MHGIRFWGSLVDIFRVGPGSGFPFLLPLIPKFFTMPCSHQGSALVNREVSGPNDLNKKGVKTPIHPFLLPLIPKFVGLRGFTTAFFLVFPLIATVPTSNGCPGWCQVLVSDADVRRWCQVLVPDIEEGSRAMWGAPYPGFFSESRLISIFKIFPDLQYF